MKLRIITQERELVNVGTSRVILPGIMGQMEILPGHTKLAALLGRGEISYFDGGIKRMDIEGGLCEVADDNICLLIFGRPVL